MRIAKQPTCGHPDRKIRSNFMCESCHRKWVRLNRPDQHEKSQRAKRRWDFKNKEKADALKKAYYLDHCVSDEYKQRTKERLFKKQYGLSLADINAMKAAINYQCPSCLKFEPTITLCVDHCHETGKVRGLLCRSCNSALGRLGDNADGVKRLLAYLEK